jgi:hypothetical membrane protein
MGPSKDRPLERLGAVLFILGPIEFVAAMGLQEALLGGAYNPLTMVISNLGVAPYDYLFNGSIILLGIMTVLAVVLTFHRFPARLSSLFGRVFLVLAGIGALGVGVFNEHTHEHGYFAAGAFIGAGIALLLFAWSFRRLPEWKGWAMPTALAGLVDMVSLVVFVATPTLKGLTERLIVVPVLIWAPFLGWHFWKVHADRSPEPIPPAAQPASA